MTPRLPAPIAKPERQSAPPLLSGDVLRWIRSEAYVGWGTRCEESPLRHAAFFALGAFARVGAIGAVRMRLSHWMPGGDGIVVVHDPHPRPVPIVPLLRETVQAYLDTRPDADDGEDWMFVNRFGRHCTTSSFTIQMRTMGNFLGIRGEEMSKAIKGFFDRCFDGERDRAAVNALRGRGSPLFDSPFRLKAVTDIERLRKVLVRNHPLAGPIEAYQGVRGRRLLEKLPSNLPAAPQAARLKPGAAMATDAVVLSLLKLPRPDDPAEREALSQRLRERHFVHLDDLRKAGLLRLREVAFLLQATTARANTWRLRRLARPDLPQRSLQAERRWKTIDADWKRRLIAEFRLPRAGESNWAFCERMSAEHGFPHPPVSAFRFLRREGEIRRPRGRPRHRRVAT